MTYRDWEKKYVKDANATIIKKSDIEMFKKYKRILKELCPNSIDDFVDLKYNNDEDWQKLKYNYRTVNRYDVQGNVPIQTILDLDKVAFYTKKTGFDFSSLTGKKKKSAKKALNNGGNAAVMLLDDEIYFSHSEFGLVDTSELKMYNGEYPAVSLSKTPIFTVKDLGDGVLRQYDTEAKFLEYVSSAKNQNDKFTVTILSEKHICESCQGVVKQFQRKYPNAIANIISGKENFYGSKKGNKTWRYRKKVNSNG